MAVEVEEHPGIAAVERLAAGAGDRSAGGFCLRQHRVDLFCRARVVRERDPAPAAAVLDSRVLRHLLTAPERDDHAAGLEEDDVVVRPRRPPAERLVELTR